MTEVIELAQYLNAKFCHELAGTLGAISNGTEFLGDSNKEMQARAIELIKVSSKQAISKLLFLRQAYGVAKSTGEASLADFKKLTEDFIEGSKVKLLFENKYIYTEKTSIDVNTVKILYCLVVVAISNLIYGGVLQLILYNQNSSKLLTFQAIGNNYKNDPEKRAILEEMSYSIPLTTNNVHTIFTRKLADELGLKITITTDSEKICYDLDKINK